MAKRDRLLSVFEKEIVPLFKEAFGYFKSGVKGISFAQLYILKQVEKNPFITVKRIAKSSHITTAAISQTINKLIEDNFVSRQQSKEDRRFYFLKITEKGEKILEENGRFREDMLKRLFSSLSDNELEGLISALRKIKEGLKER